MDMKNHTLLVGLSIVILVFIGIYSYSLIISPVNDHPNAYFLFNQDGANSFSYGDAVYGRLQAPEVVTISVDSGESFIPNYKSSTDFMVGDNLPVGDHVLVVQTANRTFTQQFTILGGLNIPLLSIDPSIQGGSVATVEATVSGFQTNQTSEGVFHWLVYDVEVTDETGEVVDSVSLYAQEHLGVETQKVSLNIPFDTATLQLKEYTLTLTVTDKLTDELISREVITRVI